MNNKELETRLRIVQAYLNQEILKNVQELAAIFQTKKRKYSCIIGIFSRKSL